MVQQDKKIIHHNKNHLRLGLIILLVIILHLPYLIWAYNVWDVLMSTVYPSFTLITSFIFFILKINKSNKEPDESNTSKSISKNNNIILKISLALTGLFWLFSVANHRYIFLSGFTLPLMIHQISYIYLGKKAVSRYLFPIYLLSVINPFYLQLAQYIMPSIKTALAKSVYLVAHLFGIDVVREGFQLTAKNFSFIIVDECSGLRSLTSALLCVIVIAYLTLRKLYSRLLLLISLMPLVFLANTMRLAIFLYAGENFGKHIALRYFHGFGCVIIYLLIYPILLGEAYLIKKTIDD